MKGLPPLGVGAQSVTCLVPGKDDLYIGTTPGILFRWRPGMEAAEELVRYDRFAAGPLNDTNPYAVDGGRYDAGTDAMDFHIGGSGDNPKKGWWRYSPGKQPEWRWVAEDGPPAKPQSPAWRVNSHGGMVILDLEFVPTNGAPVRVARATGHVTGEVRWCDAAAVWLVRSGSATFEGPLRMYMIARDHWPDRGQPGKEGAP